MVSVVWIRRKTKESFHACLDYWDTHTLCGLPVTANCEYHVDPSGVRCVTCEEKTKTSGVGPPVQD